MNFKEKLKTRLYLGISYIIIGIAMIIVFNIVDTGIEFLTSMGLALIVVGFIKIKHYMLITKNDTTLKRQQIAETDERNIAISNKAKSISFIAYIIIACIASLVLQILKETELAIVIFITVCILIAIYWISYWIIRKKS